MAEPGRRTGNLVETISLTLALLAACSTLYFALFADSVESMFRVPATLTSELIAIAALGYAVTHKNQRRAELS